MRLVKMRKVIRDRIQEINTGLEKRARGEVVLTHVPTGLTELDDQFGGIERGVNTLVVGHTGDGKSAFLSTLMDGAAKAGMGVLGLFLEDPARREADRKLARQTGMDTRDMAMLRLDPNAIERLELAEAQDTWSDLIAVHFGADVEPEEALETFRAACDEGVPTMQDGKEVHVPVGLIVVDYAQGFSDAEVGMEAIASQMARALHVLAGKYDLATVFGSQANSRVIQRGRNQWERSNGEEVDGFRPGKGDAKWSTRLGEYSKADWSIFRPGRWRLHLGDTGARDDVMEVNVNKQNYGPEGQVLFRWHGPTTSVLDRIGGKGKKK